MRSKILVATAVLSAQFACKKNNDLPYSTSQVSAMSMEAKGFSSHESSQVNEVAAPSVGANLALPARNTLPISPATWCEGSLNALKISKQAITAELAALCTGATPTARFATLINSAYTGTGEAVITPISVGMVGSDVQLFVAYAMKLNKPAVQTLLGEEKHVPSGYDVGDLKIVPKFVNPPPLNTGDCDTAFYVDQYTEVNDVIDFKETSKNELKMYRLHPNNFDFFMAARTLVAPTEQFRKAVVMRAIMADPADPKKSIAISVLNFVMNDRNGNGDNVRATFERFIEADFLALYKSQTTN